MRKICVVTGTRAEYGLLLCLLKEIKSDSELQLQIVATGMHLAARFGETYKVIESDGYQIDERVPMDLSDDSTIGVTQALGQATQGFAKAFDRLKPDVIVVLGDRYEILAAAQAAMIARIPLAHIHGGEATEGLIDEAIRHSVTKMSHFHFVAAEPYRHRVIQLGEDPKHVFNFGAPGLDNIAQMKLLERKEFESSIEFELGKKNFLVTYHPVTLNKASASEPMHELLAALDTFADARIIFTKPNSDTDGKIIADLIDDYVKKSKGRAIAHTSLGQLRYLSAIRHSDVVIGNSSSGLIEAPALKKPTVNIGDRQRGRLVASSVVSCGETKAEIVQAIEQSLSPSFQSKLAKVDSPYGSGNASRRIKEQLKSVSLDGVLMKKFFDLKQEISP
ncbi:UDP-N-acetylglucosamine 2-epimerase (hydrolyzing) [bacterium]|nr:UDP-N-acetylglucosamine 2-epimerase (hydrolyzing) [bacterium]